MANIFVFRDKNQFVNRSRGDVGDDGLVFWSYFKDEGKLKGEIRERWLTPEDFHLRRERAMLASKRNYLRLKSENPNMLVQRGKKFREENKDQQNARCREWRRQNPEKQREACRNWNKNNKDACREHRRRSLRRAIKSSSLSYFKSRMRHRVREAIKRKGFKKTSSTKEMIGCDWDVLRKYIESKFLPGMSWENKSEWEIDHIIPLASAKSEEEIKKLCHWSNLQPLWKVDNRIKSDSMPKVI